MERMLQIAEHFKATALGDDGGTYQTAAEWEAALGG
jgi:hypothetical protein